MPLEGRSFAATLVLSAVFAGLSRALLSETLEKEGEQCQEQAKDQAYKPTVPHVVLSDAFLDRYDEVAVIGDVHGCFDELQALIESNNMSGSNVLKILTGDLVRKGPKSKQVVEYVRTTPHIIAVRGNNDENALTMLDKPHDKLHKDDLFVLDLSEEDLAWMEQLPYSLSLPRLNTVVVHAGLLPGLQLDQMEPFTIMNVRNLEVDKSCPGGYKPEKELAEAGVAWGSVWEGPQHVIFGHDGVRGLQYHPNATGLDTACVHGRNLTGLFVVGPRADTLVQQQCARYMD